jgi:putative flippase GtrA
VKSSVIRFVIAGAVNTVVGYAAFLGSFYGAGLSLVASNASAYALGLLTAFLQMRLWVFPSQSEVWSYTLKFLLIFIISYSLNLLTLFGVTSFLNLKGWASQLIAMSTYSTTAFFLSRKFLGGGI